MTIIEPVLIAKKSQVGECKTSALMPILKFIAADWNLKLHKPKDFRLVRIILENSVKNN